MQPRSSTLHTFILVSVFVWLIIKPAFANDQKACYLITDQRDWGGYRLGAAEHYLEAATACHKGDHLTVAEIPVRQAGYFIIEACNPAFAITTLHISDILVSITCVKSNYKELRQGG